MCIFVVLKFAEFKFVLDQQTTYYQDFCFTYISLSYLRKTPNINISKPNVIQKSLILNVKLWKYLIPFI